MKYSLSRLRTREETVSNWKPLFNFRYSIHWGMIEIESWIYRFRPSILRSGMCIFKLKNHRFKFRNLIQKSILRLTQKFDSEDHTTFDLLRNFNRPVWRLAVLFGQERFLPVRPQNSAECMFASLRRMFPRETIDIILTCRIRNRRHSRCVFKVTKDKCDKLE